MMSDASGRLGALVLKLRHPLTKIRSRALHTLLFKLRECLVRMQELEPLHSTLIPALLAGLEPPLGVETLHVLHLLVQSHSEVFLTSLQDHGAAKKLQRAANANPELQTSYEKLLQRIYTTNFVPLESEKKEEIANAEEKHKPKEEQVKVSNVLINQRVAPNVDRLEACGWNFAQVTLVSVDDQYLFEFEVKLQLKTEIQDIVAACATFRNELLRNFPAEIFLQRPVVLQYLLHLVQQPILPKRPGTTSEQSTTDCLVEKSMEISMGVNYFDELGSKTFSNKRGNICGAVVMASLQAIESFLYALKHSRKTCLDPTHVVHKPREEAELFDSYDARRVLYPRARIEDETRVSERTTDSHLGQYSSSGAIYKIFISILPLLRSARHPRLHLLIILLSALSELPETSCVDIDNGGVPELDKLRLERIFTILGGICRPVHDEHFGFTVVDSKLELTHSMTWKLVELVIRLLRLYSGRHYLVEDVETVATGGKTYTKTRGSGRIIIPRQLWTTVKLWVAHPVFINVATSEWKSDSIVDDLSKIDATIPAFVKLKQASRHDAKLILEFVRFANDHRKTLTDFKSWAQPAILTLNVAQKTIQTRWAFNVMDTKAIADAALLTIWLVMTADNDDTGPTDDDVETIQFILCDLLSGLGQQKLSTSHDAMAIYFFQGLLDLVDSLSKDHTKASSDVRHRHFGKILCGPKFLTLLLLVLAEQSDADDRVDKAALWAILRAALHQLADVSSDKLATLFEPVIPLIQHFAYIDSTGNSSQEQRATQPKLAEILNRVEPIVPDHARYLLIWRCLLHESSYIRKAAASGILRLCSQTSSTWVDYISKHKEILQDPFKGPYASDSKNVDLEAALLETPLPDSHASAHPSSEHELSSQLSKLSHLYKVVSGTCSTYTGMKEAAFKELVRTVENASVETFKLFEELGKLSDLMALIQAILQTHDEIDSILVYQSLLLLRTLILRSRLLRSAMQRSSDMMELLMPLIFHSSTAVRAQMYYILLLLTCSAENFTPNVDSARVNEGRVGEVARIPEMLATTFGLYSNRWARCFVVTCSPTQQLQASSEVLSKHPTSVWLQEVSASLHQSSNGDCIDGATLEGTSSSDLDSVFSAEYALIVQKLRQARSHGKCLNALYHVMMMCKAWRIGRAHFVVEWEADFERYFTTPPKSERDEVILGSLVSTLSVMFSTMTRAEQLRALVVVKRKVLPLLKRSSSAIFSLQMARLLLNVSESKVSELFLSLAADTNIIATICLRFAANYAPEPVLQSLMLEVLLCFARDMHDNTSPCVSKPLQDKICKRLLDMLGPLLTIVCRHRVPGSFMDRDVFVAGSQCMIAILHKRPRASLLNIISPLQHTDSSILLDGSWASRFLFDHVSPIRALGFCVIAQAAALEPPSSRLVDMAFGTSMNENESDAVRAAACTTTTQEMLQYLERTPDQQATLTTIFYGHALAGKVLHTLCGILQGSKLLIRTASALARQVRVLFIQKNSLGSHFGDMQQELETAHENDEVYALLFQALSIREWKVKCDRYSSSCMLLPNCDDHAWRHSLLPAILDLTAELLNLLQAVCRENTLHQVSFFFQQPTLQHQLMKLAQDVYDSLDDTLSVATRLKHYEVLDLSASTLCLLLVQASDQHHEHDLKHCDAPSPLRIGADFTTTVAKLLDPQHPMEFRVSFSRVVAAVCLLLPGSLKTVDAAVIRSLGSTLFDLYHEITADCRPLDTKATADVQSRSFPFASIRRVTCSLQVLLETSPILLPLVHIKRAVPFAMTCIKELFTAIRIAGGFGGKRARRVNTSKSSHDGYVLDYCSRIQTHMEVVTSIIGGDKESQQLAKDEGLLEVVLSNWTVMKMAHVRGSQLMIRAMYLLANYIYDNDSAKSSMLLSLSPLGSERASGGDHTTSLVALLVDLANTRGEVTTALSRVKRSGSLPSEADMVLSNAACQVLKAALLNSDCVLNSVKSGSIPKLVELLPDRLKQVRQSSKVNYAEHENLAYMLSVLSSIASSEEGARFLYTTLGTALSLVLDDTLHLADDLRRNGCLFMRNLSLSQATKHHFALWEELLDPMVALCVRASDAAHGDSMCVEYVSVALWSLVYDNQKARALLLSKPATLQSLKQVLSSHSSASSANIAGILRRILMLVEA